MGVQVLVHLRGYPLEAAKWLPVDSPNLKFQATLDHEINPAGNFPKIGDYVRTYLVDQDSIEWFKTPDVTPAGEVIRVNATRDSSDVKVTFPNEERTMELPNYYIKEIGEEAFCDNIKTLQSLDTSSALE